MTAPARTVVRWLTAMTCSFALLSAGLIVYAVLLVDQRAPDCTGVFPLFAESGHCRLPAAAHFGVKFSALGTCVFLLARLIVRRRQP